MSASVRFENYEVLQREDGSVFELGRGAMGVTYRARDTDLHCDVALKVINPGILGDPEAQGRFLREARAAARLRHPNIASVFRLGKASDDTHFYAMEFCEGPTLEQAVAQNGPLPTVEALRIAMQVADALMLAEEHQLLHRDLKPANLILTARRGEGTVVKVIDFGLARSFADGHQTLASHGSSGFVGTAHFASPEQLEEQTLDIRSDIYSLGVCLWFMLDGRPPFAGSLARVMSQTLSAEPPWERLAAQPPVVVDLLRRMLAKKPDDRPATAAELRSEIDQCLRAIQAPTNAGDILRKQPAANRGLEEWEFATRYPMSEEVGSDTLGRIFRGADANHGGAPVAVRVIDAALVAVPATRRDIEAQIAAARAHPHPHLIALLDHALSSHGLCVATEWLEGFSLLDLLKHRGALTPSEVLRLLTPLADAVDHANRQGIRGVHPAKQQVHVHFPNGLSDGERENVLTSPLEEWPPHVVKAGVLSLGDEGRAGSRGMQSMMTLVPSGGGGAINGIPALARLACELLGSRADAAFAPIARLSEAGNAVLRRALSEEYSFPTVTAFVEALGASIGKSAPTSLPRTHAPKPSSSPASHSRRSAPVGIALLVLALLGAGFGYYNGIHQPRRRDREGREAKGEAADAHRTEQQRSANGETGESEEVSNDKPPIARLPDRTIPNTPQIQPADIAPHTDALLEVFPTIPNEATRALTVDTSAGALLSIRTLRHARRFKHSTATDPYAFEMEMDGTDSERLASLTRARVGQLLAFTRGNDVVMLSQITGAKTDGILRITNDGPSGQRALNDLISAVEKAGIQVIYEDRPLLLFYPLIPHPGKKDALFVETTAPPLLEITRYHAYRIFTRPENEFRGIEFDLQPEDAMRLAEVARTHKKLAILHDGEPVHLADLQGNFSRITLDSKNSATQPGIRNLAARLQRERPVPTAPSEEIQPARAIPNSQLLEFIEKKQRDEQSRDLSRILANYATTVDYRDEGMVGHDEIWQDKRRYFETWPMTTQKVKGSPAVLSATGDRAKLRFQVEFSAEKRSGEKISGIAEETIEVVQFEGLRVVSEKSRVLSREKTGYVDSLPSPRPKQLTPSKKSAKNPPKSGGSLRDRTRGLDNL